MCWWLMFNGKKPRAKGLSKNYLTLQCCFAPYVSHLINILGTYAQQRRGLCSVGLCVSASPRPGRSSSTPPPMPLPGHWEEISARWPHRSLRSPRTRSGFASARRGRGGTGRQRRQGAGRGFPARTELWGWGRRLEGLCRGRGTRGTPARPSCHSGTASREGTPCATGRWAPCRGSSAEGRDVTAGAQPHHELSPAPP